jgi:hypothetical protein
MTLHDRIRAVVEERLRIAREVAGSGVWDAYVEAGDDGWAIESDPGGDPCAIIGDKAMALHMEANDPADAILSAEHALSVVERHAIVHRNIGWLEFDVGHGELCETYAEIPVCGRCVPKHSHFKTRAEVPEGPCIEVRELATRWRVEVDG